MFERSHQLYNRELSFIHSCQSVEYFFEFIKSHNSIPDSVSGRTFSISNLTFGTFVFVWDSSKNWKTCAEVEELLSNFCNDEERVDKQQVNKVSRRKFLPKQEE